MTAPVSVMFLIDSVAGRDPHVDSTLLAAISVFRDRRHEATIRLTEGRVQELRDRGSKALLDGIKRQDAAFRSTGDPGRIAPGVYVGESDWETGAAEFFRRELEVYNAVGGLAGRIPSSYGDESWTPQSFASFDTWGIRVILSPQAFLHNSGAPFFFGGRLNLAGLRENWIVADGLTVEGAGEALVRRVTDRIAASSIPGKIVVVQVDTDAVPASAGGRFYQNLSFILDHLERTPRARIQSARQVIDRFADISYEHRIGFDQIRAIAEHASRTDIRPFHYAAGYLSPSEQVYMLASAWDETRKKGKLVRNSTVRTPLGPTEKVETKWDSDHVPAERVSELVASLMASIGKNNRLPAAVELDGGRIAIQDLLPTLAAGFQESLKMVGLPIRRAQLDASRVTEVNAAGVWSSPVYPPGFRSPRQLELAKLQMWTFKPILGVSDF